MNKNFRFPSLALIGLALLSWPAVAVAATGHNGGFSGGHMSGGFSGGHMSGGFGGGGHASGGFSHAHASAGFSGGHFNSGFAGVSHSFGGSSGVPRMAGFNGSHASNGNFASHAPTTLRFTAPHNSSVGSFAGHAGNGAFSNTSRNVAGARAWDGRNAQSSWHGLHGGDFGRFHDFDRFNHFGSFFPFVGSPFWYPDWYSLYGWPYYGDYGYYDYGLGPGYYNEYNYAPNYYSYYGTDVGNDVAAYSPAATYPAPADETPSENPSASAGTDYATRAWIASAAATTAAPCGWRTTPRWKCRVIRGCMS